MNIGKAIRERRTSLGLSQDAVARRIWGDRANQTLISQYERGVVSPTADTLERIADALDSDLLIEFVARIRATELPQATPRDNPTSSNLGHAVKSARKKAGLSQRDLAEAVFDDGRMQPIISRIERSEANPTIQMVEKIAKALNCNVLIEFELAQDD